MQTLATRYPLPELLGQEYNYDCGLTSLDASVRALTGRKIQRKAVGEIIGLTSEHGTTFEGLLAGARALGYHARVYENLILEQLRELVIQGHVIAEYIEPSDAEFHFSPVTGVDMNAERFFVNDTWHGRASVDANGSHQWEAYDTQNGPAKLYRRAAIVMVPTRALTDKNNPLLE